MTYRLIAPGRRSFDEIRSEFIWDVPKHFNICFEIIDKHSDRSDKTALYYENHRGETGRYTFGEIRDCSMRLANVLHAKGVGRGDRIAIVLPQRPETAIAHVACYRLGAVALPLSILFGPDALEFRLADSGTSAVITDSAHRDTVQALRDRLPKLSHVIDCDDRTGDGFWSLLERSRDRFDPVPVGADDPALLIYTSGTTGPPKGALLAHRCLFGNLTGFELSHHFFPQAGDLFWTPADWAWTGGLIDALLPSWYYGMPVLGYEGVRFDPEHACHLINKYRVRNAFIPPTALKMLRQLGNVRTRYDVKLRSVMSAGEMVGAELYHWAVESLGLEINEMWGQSEFNYIVGNCATLMNVKPGSMGKPYPGHEVAPVDGDGHVMPAGEIGELAAWRHDPVCFLGYWGNEQATRDKLIGNWWSTGDVGYRDDDGYLWFVGRKDDVISSAGYRIGPGEIEDCLLKHEAVAQAAAVGSPDELRGEIVKAFIVLADGFAPTPELADDIRSSVRSRLAAYEYPREIEFADELPLTTTGKVRRVELRERERRRKIRTPDYPQQTPGT